MRKIVPSTTVFLHHQGKYLFILRDKNKKVDAGRLNGIGGKIESGEDYLTNVIRETKEETGLTVKPEQIRFVGLIHLEGGYAVDWLCSFFKIEVDSKKLPIGQQCREGKLLWLTIQEVLDSDYELVDDLHYLLPFLKEKHQVFFANAQVNDREKIDEIEISKLSQ